MNKRVLKTISLIFLMCAVMIGCSNLSEKESNALKKENKNNTYPIYTANSDTYEKVVGSYVNIPNNTELMQKLTILANALSERYFKNLPIKVVKIEKVNNKNIAVINLNESKENQGIKEQTKLKGTTWGIGYFQGSTGGKVTSVTLIETFLQKDYKGQWIDGVRFLYNNGVCDFEHAADLKDINYRKLF